MKNIKNYNNFINFKIIKEDNTYYHYPYFILTEFENNPIVIIGKNEGLSLNVINDNKYTKNYKDIIEFLYNKQDIEEVKNNLIVINDIETNTEINVEIIRFEIDNYCTNEFLDLSKDVIDFTKYITEKFGIKHKIYNPIGMTPFIRLDLEKPFTFKFI
jgi:hypothetical protein